MTFSLTGSNKLNALLLTNSTLYICRHGLHTAGSCRERSTHHILGVHIWVHVLHHVGHHLSISLDGCFMEGCLPQLNKQVECYLKWATNTYTWGPHTKSTTARTRWLQCDSEMCDIITSWQRDIKPDTAVSMREWDTHWAATVNSVLCCLSIVNFSYAWFHAIHIIPYGQKFWRGIYFGGLAVMRAIRQHFHPPNFLQYVIVTYCYVTSSLCCPPSFKMSARKLQTSKEWNENSPDLVYHQLVSALSDVLWFETDPAVFTLLTVPVC